MCVEWREREREGGPGQTLCWSYDSAAWPAVVVGGYCFLAMALPSFTSLEWRRGGQLSLFICAATRRPHRAIPSHPRRPISPRGRGKLDRRGRKGSTNVVMLPARASWSGRRDAGLPCASGFNFADNGERRRARRRRSRTRLTSSTITRLHPSLPSPPEVSCVLPVKSLCLSACPF